MGRAVQDLDVPDTLPSGFSGGHGAIIAGPSRGGGYDGPALRALANSFLNGDLGLRPDNPYMSQIHQFGRPGGLASEMPPNSGFNRLALGKMVNEALRYETLYATTMGPNRAKEYQRGKEFANKPFQLEGPRGNLLRGFGRP